MRPDRNRISRFVAAEMRYFHRPLFFALLSCFTIIILVLSVLFSLLSYTTSAGSADARLYLNLSVALLILYAASYLVHRIMRWGRSPSYSLIMSFTAISFLFSAAASFMLTRAAWQDSLNAALLGGFEMYVKHLLRWSFWAPGVVLLFYCICIFIKAKSANRDGSWFFLLFPLIPCLTVVSLWLAMHFVVRKEDAVLNASIATSVYLSLMLTLAVRYAVKAILNRILCRMRTAEDSVLVRNTLREHDGKWIQWWEKKPASIETMDLAEQQSVAETSAVELAAQPIPDIAAAALDAVASKYQAQLPEAKNSGAKLSKKVKKTRPSKPEKPRHTLRDLMILALAAVRRPPVLSPAAASLEAAENSSIAEIAETAVVHALPAESTQPKASGAPETESLVTQKHSGANLPAAPSAKISAPPDEERTPSKLHVLLVRAVTYLKKPYSPPVETRPFNKKGRRAQTLARLAAVLSAVAARRQAAEKNVDSSPVAQRHIWHLPSKK